MKSCPNLRFPTWMLTLTMKMRISGEDYIFNFNKLSGVRTIYHFYWFVLRNMNLLEPPLKQPSAKVLSYAAANFTHPSLYSEHGAGLPPKPKSI